MERVTTSERQNAIKTSELVGIIQYLEARHKKLGVKMRADLKMKGRCLQEDMKTLIMLNSATRTSWSEGKGVAMTL